MPMALWAFLAAAVVPLAKKLLFALGIGWVTYEGLNLIGSQIQNAVLAQWGAIGAVPLNILNMSGASTAVGILLGAITAKIALVAVARLGKVTT